MTQQQVADMIGRSQGYISAVENEKSALRDDEIVAIAKGLDYDPLFLSAGVGVTFAKFIRFMADLDPEEGFKAIKLFKIVLQMMDVMKEWPGIKSEHVPDRE